MVEMAVQKSSFIGTSYVIELAVGREGQTDDSDRADQDATGEEILRLAGQVRRLRQKHD